MLANLREIQESVILELFVVAFSKYSVGGAAIKVHTSANVERTFQPTTDVMLMQ